MDWPVPGRKEEFLLAAPVLKMWPPVPFPPQLLNEIGLCATGPPGAGPGRQHLNTLLDRQCSAPGWAQQPASHTRFSGLNEKCRCVLMRVGFSPISDPSQRSDFTADGSKLKLSKCLFCYCSSWTAQTCPGAFQTGLAHGESRIC